MIKEEEEGGGGGGIIKRHKSARLAFKVHPAISVPHIRKRTTIMHTNSNNNAIVHLKAISKNSGVAPTASLLYNRQN